MPLKLQKKFMSKETPITADIPYLENTMLLMLTAMLVLSKYVPFLASPVTNILYSCYLCVFVAYKAFTRASNLVTTYKQPTLEMTEENVINIAKILLFVCGLVVSLLGLLPLNTDKSLGNLMRSLFTTVFTYMPHDLLCGTNKYECVSSAAAALVSATGGVLQYLGYNVFGVAAALSMVIKGVAGMLDGGSVKRVTTLNFVFVLISLGCVMMALKYNFTFELPDLKEVIGAVVEETPK